MSLRLVRSGDEGEGSLGVLSEQFLHRMEEERHSLFLTASGLVLGYEDELLSVVQSLHGRGFGWLHQRESIGETLTSEPELDQELYGQSVFVGASGVHRIIVSNWTDHVGIGIQRMGENYSLNPGILAQVGSRFFLVQTEQKTVNTPWMLIAPRNKP